MFLSLFCVSVLCRLSFLKYCAVVFCVYFMFQYLVFLSCVFFLCLSLSVARVSPRSGSGQHAATHLGKHRSDRAGLPCPALQLRYMYPRVLQHVHVVHMPGWVAESPRQPGKQGHAVFWPTCSHFSKTEIYLWKFERFLEGLLNVFNGKEMKRGLLQLLSISPP